MSTLLSCRHVVKTYGQARAVDDVSFDVAAGSVLALVGENGAGKSTLLNVLTGVVRADAGSVTVATHHGSFASPIAMVHQELSLFDNLTVGENLSLGTALPVTIRDHRGYARRALDNIGVVSDIDRPVHALPLGERQLVELAKAVAQQPAVLVLDEPTSALEPAEVDLLFKAVQRFRAGGGAVIFVSHRFEEVYELCDTVVVLRDGRVVLDGDLGSVTERELVRAMAGRDVVEMLGAPAASATPAAVEGDVPALALRDVRVAPGTPPIDLTVPAGAITAIAGLEGHGQAAIAEIAAGVRRPHSGTVSVFGSSAGPRSVRAAIAAGVGYVTPDRRRSGIYAGQSLRLNAIIPWGRKIFRRRPLSSRRSTMLVSEALASMSTKYTALLQPIDQLSGGNQQKVVMGRWLLADKLRILVLNDPTRGVDVNAREQIYSMITGLVESGTTVLLVSTDLNEIMRLASRVYVVYEGAVRGCLAGSVMTQHSVMTLATGGTLDE